MSTSLCPHSLFGQQLHRLQSFDWNVRFYGDDFFWSEDAQRIAGDPGWRFSVRVNTEYLAAIPTAKPFARAWHWLCRVERCMQRLAGYQSRYGVEYYTKYADVPWNDGPPRHRTKKYEYAAGTFHDDIGWRFLDPARSSMGDYFFAHDYFRYDFSIDAAEAVQLRLGGAFPVEMAKLPLEWPSA